MLTKEDPGALWTAGIPKGVLDKTVNQDRSEWC